MGKHWGDVEQREFAKWLRQQRKEDVVGNVFEGYTGEIDKLLQEIAQGQGYTDSQKKMLNDFLKQNHETITQLWESR